MPDRIDKRHTASYVQFMVQFDWNNEKNEWLKAKRRVSFEEVVLILEQEGYFDIIDHPNQGEYPGQEIAIVRIEEYAYLVPFVREGNTIFLKTIIPNRKATSKYKGK